VIYTTSTGPCVVTCLLLALAMPPRRVRLIVTAEHGPSGRMTPPTAPPPPPPVENTATINISDSESGSESDDRMEMEIDELAGDDDDEYFAWATALRVELEQTPAEDVAGRLYEAYEEWGGEIRSEYQVKRLRLLKETQEASEAHAAQLGSGYRQTRSQTEMNEWVAREFRERRRPMFEKLEQERDEKLGIVQAWYKHLGASFSMWNTLSEWVSGGCANMDVGEARHFRLVIPNNPDAAPPVREGERLSVSRYGSMYEDD
jgi:hypothetical protein